MAVKPLTQPEYWATDAVYTTGPFIGQPQKVVPPSAFAAEGHRPGTAFPTPAEYENSQQHNLTGLARWVFAGSSAGAADAHVLETNAAGRTAATGLTINDAVDENAVTISSAATALNFGLLVSCTTGGTAMATSIGNASAINYLAGTGSGALAEGVRVAMTGTPIGGNGVRVNSDAATAGSGVRVEHSGSGAGVLALQVGSGIAGSFDTSGGTGIGLRVFGNSSNIASSFVGGTNQLAIQAVAGANAPAAIGVIGAGSSYGVDAAGGIGSASADGVRGTATNANATGVTGRSAVGAGAGSGVVGEGRGSGQFGVTAISQTGIALVAQGDTTSPTHPAMRLVPQDADPSASSTSGNMLFRDSAGYRQLRACVAGFGYRSVLTFGPGSALYARSAQAFNAAPPYLGFTSILTASALDAQGNGFASFAAGHQVLIRFTADIRTGTATADRCNVRFIDVTAGGLTICTWTGAPPSGSGGFALAANTDWQRSIVAQIMYPPQSDGDLTIRVEMSSNTNQQFVRNGVLEIIGTF